MCVGRKSRISVESTSYTLTAAAIRSFTNRSISRLDPDTGIAGRVHTGSRATQDG
jgi:hypothetical protein